MTTVSQVATAIKDDSGGGGNDSSVKTEFGFRWEVSNQSSSESAGAYARIGDDATKSNKNQDRQCTD